MTWQVVALVSFISALLARFLGQDASDGLQIALLCMLVAKAYE